jgi:uncharacterized protein YjbI with pentapeptide repeats
MANDDHIAHLKKGVAAWNAWREENPNIRPDLSGANLGGAELTEEELIDIRSSKSKATNVIAFSTTNLSKANLAEANLQGANLTRADLKEAILCGANLTGANLHGAQLFKAELDRAKLEGADLQGAVLGSANLSAADLGRTNLAVACLVGASLTQANLGGADLSGADLRGAELVGASLRGANLRWANLVTTNLSRVDLSGADLRAATLVATNLTDADLTGCCIHGISAWRLKLNGAKQQSLVITVDNEPEITVDHIEVAQFIYLMLNNQKVRDVIDTITSKAVLILGRFTAERKAVLDALREELRKRDYLPILFDFAVPATRDITETVSLLARMARFIIADLTDPSSIPQELQAIVPHLAVPVQPLLEGSFRSYAMFKDLLKYEWVLPVYRYEGLEPLLETLAEKVIAPAEAKVNALAERRRMIEAELTKSQ